MDNESAQEGEIINHGKNHEASPEMIRNKSSGLLKNNLGGVMSKRSARVSFGINSNKAKKTSIKGRDVKFTSRDRSNID